MITITIMDKMGVDHSKTRPTFGWAWSALIKANPELVPTLENQNRDIHGFSITHTPLFRAERYIQLGSYFGQAGMWIWRNR